MFAHDSFKTNIACDSSIKRAIVVSLLVRFPDIFGWKLKAFLLILQLCCSFWKPAQIKGSKDKCARIMNSLSEK